MTPSVAKPSKKKVFFRRNKISRRLDFESPKRRDEGNRRHRLKNAPSTFKNAKSIRDAIAGNAKKSSNNYVSENPMVFHFRALKFSGINCHSRWPRDRPTPDSIAGHPLKGPVKFDRKLRVGINKKSPDESEPIADWLREMDLNHRPPGYGPDELPGCSIPRDRLSIGKC